MAEEGWIEISHSGFKEHATVTQRAFDLVWKDKGWKEVVAKEDKAAAKEDTTNTGKEV